MPSLPTLLVRYLPCTHGDTETAKLHSKIAGDALEESGHFLSKDDYSDLIYQITRYFRDAQKDKKDNH